VSPGYSAEYSYVFLVEEPEKTQPRQEGHEVTDTVEIPLEETSLRGGWIRDMRTSLKSLLVAGSILINPISGICLKRATKI
jgi:hypothetical protein